MDLKTFEKLNIKNAEVKDVLRALFKHAQVFKERGRGTASMLGGILNAFIVNYPEEADELRKIILAEVNKTKPQRKSTPTVTFRRTNKRNETDYKDPDQSCVDCGGSVAVQNKHSKAIAKELAEIDGSVVSVMADMEVDEVEAKPKAKSSRSPRDSNKPLSRAEKKRLARKKTKPKQEEEKVPYADLLKANMEVEVMNYFKNDKDKAIDFLKEQGAPNDSSWTWDRTAKQVLNFVKKETGELVVPDFDQILEDEKNAELNDN